MILYELLFLLHDMFPPCLFLLFASVFLSLSLSLASVGKHVSASLSLLSCFSLDYDKYSAELYAEFGASEASPEGEGLVAPARSRHNTRNVLIKLLLRTSCRAFMVLSSPQGECFLPVVVPTNTSKWHCGKSRCILQLHVFCNMNGLLAKLFHLCIHWNLP